MGKAAKSEQPRDTTSHPAAVATPAAGAVRPFWRAIVPAILLDSTPAEWLLRLPAQRRHLLLLTGLAVLVFVPYLGAVGFWDPWEPEYNEVAREMITRGDFIHPFYYSGYFLSKPVLMFWLMDIGQLLAGINDPARGIAIWTEWCVRSVFALTALFCVLMLYLAVAKTISRRAGVWAAVILVTCPFFFLLARQTMADMPFVAFNTGALCCLMIALFEKEHVQDGWLYAFYALVGVAVLAKGPLAIGLVGGTALLYFMLSGDWGLLKRLRLVTGPLLTLLIAGPWFATMLSFRGLDYEDQDTFFWRFIIHDNFQRLGYDPTKNEFVAGVHTTTPNTTFVYFIEQLGFGLFPWVGLVPGVIASFLAAPRLTDARTRREKARLFVIAWALFTFVIFSFSATKFHHYIFPMVPALAVLFALFVEKVLDEGVSKYALPLLLGLAVFGMVAQNLAMTPKHLTDLFVYNYERPYPTREVDERALFTIGHWVVTSQAVLVILFAAAPLVALMGIPEVRRWLAAPFGARKRVSEEPEDRFYVVGAVAGLALCFAVFISSYHWRKLSAQWTQRDLFWEYLQQSRPSEPIGAYQMNWHGETFYSRNMARQMKDATANAELHDFVAEPGRHWILTEAGRLNGMKTTIGAGYDVQVIDKTNNKYALVVVSKTSD